MSARRPSLSTSGVGQSIRKYSCECPHPLICTTAFRFFEGPQRALFHQSPHQQ